MVTYANLYESASGDGSFKPAGVSINNLRQSNGGDRQVGENNYDLVSGFTYYGRMRRREATTN